jgi:hypothetical protein
MTTISEFVRRFLSLVDNGEFTACATMMEYNSYFTAAALVYTMINRPAKLDLINWPFGYIESRMVGGSSGEYTLAIVHLAVIAEDWRLLVELINVNDNAINRKCERVVDKRRREYELPAHFITSTTPMPIVRLLATGFICDTEYRSIDTAIPFGVFQKWATEPLSVRLSAAREYLGTWERSLNLTRMLAFIPDIIDEFVPARFTKLNGVWFERVEITCDMIQSDSRDPDGVKQCAICMDTMSNATMECGHAQYCYTCLSKVKCCPTCRAQGTVIKLFF